MSFAGYRLSYNGIPLDVTSGSDISRQHIYSEDDTTYLYTKWVFSGIFIYNPQATSFDTSALRAPGVLPTPSDVNIREALRAQRRKLVYQVPDGTSSGGLLNYDTLLSSPQPNSQTDAANGPTVERCNIIQAQGSKTFICDIRIVALVNECPATDSNGVRSPLLSHRWKRTEKVDKNYASVIITDGQAIFRSDSLLSFGFVPANNPLGLGWPAFPDQFRRDLFHPIPNWFKRDEIHVIAQEDGLTYNYRIVDKQKTVGGPYLQGAAGLGVTEVEAQATSWYSQESWFSSIDITKVIPQFRQHVTARVWGDPLISKNYLQRMAISVCLGFLPNPSRTGNSSEFILRHNLTENFVQCEMTGATGLAESFNAGNAGNDATAFGGIARVRRTFDPLFNRRGSVICRFDDGIESGAGQRYLPIVGIKDTNNFGPIPAPSGDDKSRGTWLGNILAQALSGRCVRPPAPPKLADTTTAFGGRSSPFNPSQEKVAWKKLY